MAKYFSLTFNIRTTLVALILLLTVPYLVQVLGIIFLPKTVSVWRQLSLYQWLAAGMVTYAVVYIYVMGKGWDTEQRQVEAILQTGSQLYQVFNCPSLYTQCKQIRGQWKGLQ